MDTTIATIDKNQDGATVKCHDYFDFEWSGTRNDVETILALKDTPISNPRKFQILGPTWDARLLRTLVDICFYFKSQGLLWEKLEIVFHYLDHSQCECDLLACFLYQVNSLSLFKHLSFYPPQLFRPEEEMSEKEFLFSGITLNERIEKIEVCWSTAISNGDIRVLSSLLRTTKTMKQLHVCFFVEDRNMISLLSEGLSGNATLKQVTLDLGGDEAVASIVVALAKHPSLQELRINTPGLCDDQGQRVSGNLEIKKRTSQAIRKLLTTSNTLSELMIRDCCTPSLFDDECILRGLNDCRCPLKKIDIGGHALRDSLDRIMFLPHPTIERIVFPRYYPLEVLVRATHRKDRRTKPIVIEMDQDLDIPFETLLLDSDQDSDQDPDLKYQKIVMSYCNLLKELLHNHPEIRLDIYKESNFFYIDNGTEKEEFMHVCDFNWFGRYLLDTNNNQGMMAVPLSLWSLVLAKPTSRPSVVYEFLKREVLLDHIMTFQEDNVAIAATKSTSTQSIIVDNDGNGNAGEQHDAA